MGGGLSSRPIGGRYVLCGEIASGGMATVHLARQIGAAGFARIVAVKRLHERYARDPDFVAMFLDEGRLVARVRHPNVVQTIDVVAEEDELFLVMEYVHGESLLKLVQTATRGGLLVPLRIACAILVGGLHGLHEAHEAKSETGEALGIVHRDVSPHNILVGIDGVPRVLDFGVAKASERVQTTQEGQLKGKLSYMAPEQVKNRAVDRRTDVYSAAVCLWETLTGSKLFSGGSEAAVLNQVLTGPVRPPSVLNREVSPDLDAVVLRGLAREMDGRYATARDMALAIEQVAPLATASEIGAWVKTTCQTTIEGRQQLISSVEAKTSSHNMQQAVDSLRSMTGSGARAAPGSGFTPAGAPAVTSPPPNFPSPPGSYPGTQGAMQVNVRHAKGSGKTILAAFVGLGLLVGLGIVAGFFLFVKRRAADLPPAAAASTIVVVDAGAPAVAAPAPKSCPDGMAMVPGGRFFMGSDDDLPAEKPAHNVTVAAFCMDRFEVTTAAYKACSDRGDCKRAGTSNRWDGITPKETKLYDPLCNAAVDDRGKHPVNCVEWSMADRFCRAEGKRLPTEAEWEFAARGSDGRKYPWGDKPPSSKHLNACGAECEAWFKKKGAPSDGTLYSDSDGFPTTAPVGSFPQGTSRWEIQDIVGNVWEWTADYYADYPADDQTDPKGPDAGKTKVIRGGAWNGSYADWVRPTFRFHTTPETRSHGIGFRCAKTY